MRPPKGAAQKRSFNGDIVVNRIVSTGIVCAVLALGCRPGEVIEPPDMKAPVRVGEVERAAVELTVKTMGTLKAIEQAALLAESEGRFALGSSAAGKPLREGDEVAAGQAIARLKNPELVATIAIEARKEDLKHARRALERAEEQVAEGIISDGETEPTQATVTKAKYAYEVGLAQLEKFTIRSPIAGRIVKLAEIVDGDRVVPGTEIATIMNYRTIVAEVDIANPDFSLVQPGQDARITNFTLTDETFLGAVTSISPIADPATRAFKAEIEIANEAEKLRPGMYVRAEIVVDRHADAVVVPPELVVTRNNLPVVFIVEEEKAVAREVHLGIETKDATEIVNGVEPGDVLIVEGFETLRDGTPVSVSK